MSIATYLRRCPFQMNRGDRGELSHKSGAMAAPCLRIRPIGPDTPMCDCSRDSTAAAETQVQGLIIHHPTGFAISYDLEVEEVLA